MHYKKDYLDLLLVPSGLLIMFVYHLFLLYRYLNLPHKTAMGFENFYREIWVEKIMKAQPDKDVVDTALTVISSNTTAATFMASVALTLSSLIGAWLAASSNPVFSSELIYGDTGSATISIKYICLLTCFLLAFSCFVQSARHFVLANYLVSIPDIDIPVEHLKRSVIRGGDFWCLGLRALYFALNLLLWFFGPIPMFVSSVLMVVLLHFLDVNSKDIPHHHRLGKITGDRYSSVIV